MQPDDAVVLLQAFDDDRGLAQAVDELAIKEFIAQPGVGAFVLVFSQSATAPSSRTAVILQLGSAWCRVSSQVAIGGG